MTKVYLTYSVSEISRVFGMRDEESGVPYPHHRIHLHKDKLLGKHPTRDDLPEGDYSGLLMAWGKTGEEAWERFKQNIDTLISYGFSIERIFTENNISFEEEDKKWAEYHEKCAAQKGMTIDEYNEESKRLIKEMDEFHDKHFGKNS